MGCYHNLLDKKYFHKSIYIKKWEKEFNVKIKDYPLQYELVFETYNTLIKYNNILFSKNYIAKSKKVDKIINLLNEYLRTYKNKIHKSFDIACIHIYEDFEEHINELTEMKQIYEEKGKTYNLTILENDIEKMVEFLSIVNFDYVISNKGLTYEKKPNDKLPKQITCKLLTTPTEPEECRSIMINNDKSKKQSDEFIKDYFNKTGIDLTQDKIQGDIIFLIHSTIENINNTIVNFIINNNKDVLNFSIPFLEHSILMMKDGSTWLEDIYYRNLIKKLDKIYNLILKGDINKAYQEIQIIIKENDKLYERIS